MQTAVVAKYISVKTVLVYRNTTMYVAATTVITVRQYNLNSKLTFSVAMVAPCRLHTWEGVGE